MWAGFVGRKGVSLERLRTLCAVAEAGGVMKAAGDDPNRQSQYSRQIKELEEALGFKLLDRMTVPHRLTASGQEIERVARGFFEELGRILDRDAGKRPVVSIGAGESIIQWLLLPLLAGRAASDGVTFRFHNLKSRTAEERVRNRRLDLAVVGLTAPPVDLGCEKIASYGMVVVAKKGVFRKNRLSWSDLSRKQLAVLEGAGRLRRVVDELAAGMTDPPEVGLECTSYPQVIEASLEGGFVGIVPQIVQSATLHPELKVWKLPELSKIMLDLYLLWHHEPCESCPELRATIRRLRSGKK
jgi:DNA-binding transcriptional LysR family regulator